MKRYIKSSYDTEIHLRDLIKEINCIAIVPDINSYRMDHIFGSDDIDYSEYSDNDLLDISDEEMSGITDINVLLRIYKNQPYRLTKDQCNLLNRADIRITTDIDDIQHLLELMRNCNKIVIENRGKNNAFLHIHNLTDADELDIIHSLTVSEFVKQIHGLYGSHLGSQLYVFQPKRPMNDKHGNYVPDFELYIKVDETQTFGNGSAVVVVAFHATRNEEKRQKHRDDEYYRSNT